MPGLVGVAGQVDPKCAAALLADIIAAVNYDPSHQVDKHTETGCALGRVGLGFQNVEPQPLWNETGTICVMLDGELYDYAPQKEVLVAAGRRFLHHNDAEFLLRLYEEVGEEFAAQLNGSFVAAIWERDAGKLVLVTDRMGSHPLYYAHMRNKLIFAPNVHGLLADPALSRAIDHAAIAQAFTFDHILDDRTWLANVRLMPQASTLVFEQGAVTIRPYYTLRYATSYAPKSEHEYVEGLVYHLRQAVTRQAKDTLAAGLLLSGGLDSRLLAAAMRDGPLVDPLLTFSWGIPNCDDARFGRSVAHEIGATHHYVELRSDHLPTIAEQGVRLTNGSNCIHYHALATLDQYADKARVIYKGVLGDAMMGTALTRHFWADYAGDAAIDFHLRAHRDRGVLLFPPDEHSQLFTDAFQAKVNGAVMEGYRAGMLASGATQVADQRIYFDLRQRVPRMTWNGVESVRSRAIVRLPYADNDLVEFSLNIPPGFRFERHLMKRALIERYTALAQIPLTENGLPLSPCLRDVTIRTQRMLAWHLHKVGLRRSPYIPARSYARYAHWFRTVLRDWVNGVLLSPAAQERGYFAPGAVRRLLDEHMAGADHAVKLGAMLGLELWHRQFLD